MICPSVTLQSNEVASSTHMELEGLKRCLAVMEERGIKVTNVVTDRHTQVKKYMREQHKDKNHEYDVWHVAKSRCQLNKVSVLLHNSDCIQIACISFLI